MPLKLGKTKKKKRKMLDQNTPQIERIFLVCAESQVRPRVEEDKRKETMCSLLVPFV